MRQSDLLRRIGFIRYVYKLGEQQAGGPAPYSAVAILTFYDTIEWFLITACDHFDVKVKKSAGIYDYFDGIDGYKKILGKSIIDKVSSSRNELKHRLTIPSDFSVKEAQFATKTFLDENYLKLFNRYFDDVSMSDLITNECVSAHLREARSLMDNNEFEPAMDHICEAFNSLVHEFRLNLMPSWAVACGVDELSLSISPRTSVKTVMRKSSLLNPRIRPVDFVTIFS
jgi:hypothetical protein